MAPRPLWRIACSFARVNLFSLGLLRERLRTSLWIVPAGGVAAAVALAKLLPLLEARIPHGESAWYLFPGQAESARSLLSTIAASVMTFTGLVFSITILVLQLASSQFSPRVLRTFLGDRLTRFSMACFIGTFVYAMALLPEVRGADAYGGERVPAFAVFFAFVLVLVSVAIFIRYIHGMAQSIRAVHVLRRVTEESARIFTELYPKGAALEPDHTVALPEDAPTIVVRNGDVGGVAAAVDAEALLAAALENDAVIEVVPQLGDFVPRGGILLRVWGEGWDEAEALRQHVAIAEERTPYQDPAFAFRQLVDIAERALSPGINDPTTAVQALDHIHDLLAELADRQFPAVTRVDDEQCLRLVLPRPDWDALVHLAFDEIRHYGRGSIQIARRLRAALDDLLLRAPPHRRGVLRSQIEELDRSLDAFHGGRDRGRARSPSPQGQGAVRDRRGARVAP